MFWPHLEYHTGTVCRSLEQGEEFVWHHLRNSRLISSGPAARVDEPTLT